MNNGYKPLIVALFLAVGALGVGFLHSSGSGSTDVRDALHDISKSSPVFVGVAQGAEMSDSATLSENASVGVNDDMADSVGQFPPENVPSSDGAIQDPGQPIGAILTKSKGANSNTVANQSQLLPNFNSYFIRPAPGNDLGVLDNNNGVNIVNSCGIPVIAAADGIVVPDPNISNALGGWNDGYGNFVLIQHAFGNDVFTRYAHLQKSLVQIGDYVKQGQEIGLIGQTGETTNCELDFEVIGAQNPFAN